MKYNLMNDTSVIDPDIHSVLLSELERGRNGLEMIASENYASKAVMQVTGSILTNKYSEGYPGKRYYSGNEFVDIAENLAIDRAKKLFNTKYVNVQPHSGSTANMEVYFALLKLGDPILAMSLDHGGHLTHGHFVNFSGKFYNFKHYSVDEKTHLIDMDEVHKLSKETQPKMIIAGFSAYPRQLDFKHFKEIADDIGAYLLSDIAHISGLVAGGTHPSPFPYSDVVTTTTHKTLRGPRGAIIMTDHEEISKKVNSAVFPGMQGGPLENVIAAKAVAFKEALDPSFKNYAKNIIENSKSLANSLVENGAKISTDGTDNHLVLMDISMYDIGGKIAEHTLDQVGIFTNKNMIPFDKRSPFDPSGIRIGTPALTTRGLNTSDMGFIGELIVNALQNHNNTEKLNSIKSQVQELSNKYPLYPELKIS